MFISRIVTKNIFPFIRKPCNFPSFSTCSHPALSRLNPKTMGDCKGILLNEIIEKMTEFAPLSLAENWDNVGLLIEPTNAHYVSQILLTNDLTEDVVNEARELNANLIVSYHPHIFAPLKSISQKTWKERISVTCLENRIAVFSPHTSWDSIEDGVGDWLARCIPHERSSPIILGPEFGVGMGRLCKLSQEISIQDAIDRIKLYIRIPHVRLALARGKTIRDKISSMAVCPGSGASVLRGVTADLLLTGEMLHHDVLEATQNGSHVILINHSDSERGFLRHFAEKLHKWFPKDVQVAVSKRDSDPLKTI